PFHSWVPEVYPAAPAPVTAVLAGVVKKVGVYGAIRVFGTLLNPLGGFFADVILVIALASTLYGGWGGISRDDILDVLSYSSIAQVGFIFLGVAVGVNPALPADVRVLGITAALVYSLNHALIKSMLFLIGGSISEIAFTTEFDALGGLAKRAPVVSYSFFVGAIALIGIPPLNGFFGKLLVFDAGARAGSALVVGGALAGAVLTILYLSRTWMRAFWGEEGRATGMVGDSDITVVIPVVVLVVSIVLMGILFDPVFEYAHGAAEAALDSGAYVDAVIESGAGGGQP
ncbi:MAG: proton-conducting transporter membrane subunit, partial [Halobacteria archaeon]|nr:proton-conducting transporter membrane subunit [Halobacteria archaeon]